MRSFIYKCPTTGTSVHTRVPKDLIGPDTVSVPMDCPICNRSHLINPADCEEPGDDDRLGA
jgi:hypothetical protein